MATMPITSPVMPQTIWNENSASYIFYRRYGYQTIFAVLLRRASFMVLRRCRFSPPLLFFFPYSARKPYRVSGFQTYSAVCILCTLNLPRCFFSAIKTWYKPGPVSVRDTPIKLCSRKIAREKHVLVNFFARQNEKKPFDFSFTNGV